MPASEMPFELTTDDILAGGGATDAMLRATDWAASPLGQPHNWPQPLKTLVGVMLAANQPMFTAWGPDRILLYNDFYAPMLADRHPWALGNPFLEVWSEASDELTPLIDQVFAGSPVHMDDFTLHLGRSGVTEEARFAFSYTPVRSEAGVVEGLFCACTETTSQVLASRRWKLDTSDCLKWRVISSASRRSMALCCRSTRHGPGSWAALLKSF